MDLEKRQKNMTLEIKQFNFRCFSLMLTSGRWILTVFQLNIAQTNDSEDECSHGPCRIKLQVAATANLYQVTLQGFVWRRKTRCFLPITI